jgi:hypothetical protein
VRLVFPGKDKAPQAARARAFPLVDEEGVPGDLLAVGGGMGFQVIILEDP